MSTTAPPDLATLVEHLDSETIAGRLAELDREYRALRVLLRAVRARERHDQRRQQVVPHGREVRSRA